MLHEIGMRHGTDKADADHAFRGESYLHVYERYLEPIRGFPITLLELGVKTGASMRMWKEYFPRGDIRGVDINPDCRRHAEERITVHTLSQDDEHGLNSIADESGGFDVVLDDCSHINSLTIASHRILWPRLKPGGLYIIEDLGMSRVDYSRVVNPDTFMDGELAANVARGVDPAHRRADLTDRFEDIVQRMDNLHGDVRFLHFWPNIAIMQKCPTPADQ
jgi:hypothetical protein